MKVKRIGVDLAKNVFQVHGVDGNEQPIWRRQLSRARWVDAVTAKLVPGGEIGMEACAGAHHWARTFQSRGYPVKLIAPQFVKPYVKTNKHSAVVIRKTSLSSAARKVFKADQIIINELSLLMATSRGFPEPI